MIMIQATAFKAARGSFQAGYAHGMSSVTTRPSGNAAIGDLVTLADDRAGSAVVIAPGRGALVTSFRVAGRELLYLDESTLGDPSKNVRGGIPILFPSPGKLENDTWQHDGRKGVMKQHGFARNLEWRRTVTRTDAAAVTLTLASSDATIAQYPWEFRADFIFALEETRFRITSAVRNAGASPMPFALGFHPYFHVVDKAQARIDTRATRAFDNVAKKDGPFAGFDLTRPEVDLHLLDHGSTASALHLGDGGRIDVRASSDFTQWVVWTLAGKDFVCLEPWTSPGNALNTGERLITIAPGESHESWMEIAFTA
jgi:galactose mutarotase-like enzyme